MLLSCLNLKSYNKFYSNLWHLKHNYLLRKKTIVFFAWLFLVSLTFLKIFLALERQKTTARCKMEMHGQISDCDRQTTSRPMYHRSTNRGHWQEGPTKKQKFTPADVLNLSKTRYCLHSFCFAPIGMKIFTSADAPNLFCILYFILLCTHTCAYKLKVTRALQIWRKYCQRHSLRPLVSLRVGWQVFFLL